MLRNDIGAIGGDAHGWLLQDRRDDRRLKGIEVDVSGLGLPRQEMPPRAARVVGQPVITIFLERGKVVTLVASSVQWR